MGLSLLFSMKTLYKRQELLRCSLYEWHPLKLCREATPREIDFFFLIKEVTLFIYFLSKLYSQLEARTHDPEIKNCMVYQLSPKIAFIISLCIISFLRGFWCSRSQTVSVSKITMFTHHCHPVILLAVMAY